MCKIYQGYFFFLLPHENKPSHFKYFHFKDMIGRSLDMIGAYNDLDNKQQVVALIDDVSIWYMALSFINW